MRALELITGHVTYKLHYNQIYQMKTTLMRFDVFDRTFEVKVIFKCTIFLGLRFVLFAYNGNTSVMA